MYGQTTHFTVVVIVLVAVVAIIIIEGITMESLR